MLVESAWTYRHSPRVGSKKLHKLEQASAKVGLTSRFVR